MRIGIVLSLAAVVSVLAFGGVETIGFAPAQAAVALLAVAEFWRRGWPPLGWPTRIVLAVLLLVPLLQLVPLPGSAIARLAPGRANLEQDIFTSLDLLVSRYTISVNPYETQMALLRLICYLLVFLLAIRSYRLRGRQTGLMTMLLGVGLFEAIYGVVQYLTGWQYIFTYAKRFYTNDATGTYINHNHFAGLLEMALPFLLAGILLRIPSHRRDTRSRWVEAIVSPWTSHLLRDIVLFALMALALLFSRSRMGIAGALTGLLVVAVISYLYTRRGLILAVVFLALAIPAAYSAWVGLGPIVERFDREGGVAEMLEQDRLPIWRDTRRLIGDHPWLGTGLGSYRWAIFHYQSHALHSQYEHAHNDYMEFAADVGIPVSVLLFGSLWILAGRVGRRALQLEHSHDRVLATGCAGAMAAILTHEIVDFNLQIPANALLFAWIAGSAAALVQKSPHTGEHSL